MDGSGSHGAGMAAKYLTKSKECLFPPAMRANDGRQKTGTAGSTTILDIGKVQTTTPYRDRATSKAERR
jgi:hypothetical protein